MTRFIALALALSASPAMAASGPFFSLWNTDFVVLLAFLLFIGVLVYFKVPAMLGKMLDNRADTIRSELDEARALREEAQEVLASFERRATEAREQAQNIVDQAREQALAAAEEAKAELATSVERRMKAAEDQIASAEASAVREVRDRAVQVAISSAADAISKNMKAAESNALIEASIKEVEAKLH